VLPTSASTSRTKKPGVRSSLQRVHKVFPTAVPDRDFYRKHGKYADAAWKEHFPRFKDFVGAALRTPAETVVWHIDQAAELIKQHAASFSEQDLEIVVPKMQAFAIATFAAMEEGEEV
jgi:hypothetical protein